MLYSIKNDDPEKREFIIHNGTPVFRENTINSFVTIPSTTNFVLLDFENTWITFKEDCEFLKMPLPETSYHIYNANVNSDDNMQSPVRFNSSHERSVSSQNSNISIKFSPKIHSTPIPESDDEKENCNPNSPNAIPCSQLPTCSKRMYVEDSPKKLNNFTDLIDSDSSDNENNEKNIVINPRMGIKRKNNSNTSVSKCKKKKKNVIKSDNEDENSEKESNNDNYDEQNNIVINVKYEKNNSVNTNENLIHASEMADYNLRMFKERMWMQELNRHQCSLSNELELKVLKIMYSHAKILPQERVDDLVTLSHIDYTYKKSTGTPLVVVRTTSKFCLLRRDFHSNNHTLYYYFADSGDLYYKCMNNTECNKAPTYLIKTFFIFPIFLRYFEQNIAMTFHTYVLDETIFDFI